MNSSISIHSTRKFRTDFLGCISRRPLHLRICSAFVGELPGFGTLVNFARSLLIDEDVSFSLVTRPPSATDNGCISEFEAIGLLALGVNLYYRKHPTLHSKVYQFDFREGDRASFVGSANFTKGGLDLNDETVAAFRSKAENDLVKQELDRLFSYGAYPHHQWVALDKHKK